MSLLQEAIQKMVSSVIGESARFARGVAEDDLASVIDSAVDKAGDLWR